MRMRHIVICGLSGCTIYYHIISLTTWFLKNTRTQCFLISLQILSETILILRRIQWEVTINVYRSSRKSIRYSFQILTSILLTWRIWWAPNNVSRWQMGLNSAFKWLMKFEFLNRSPPKKNSNIKFHENRSSGSRVVPCGRTDGQTWLSQVCERT